MNNREKIEFIKRKAKTDLKVCKHFGFSIGAANFLSTVVFRMKTKVGRRLNIYEHERAKQYIRKNFGDLYRDFQPKQEKNIPDDAPIWILWWQGESQAPSIVKKCINSVRAHCGGHPVIVLDEYSYSNYVKVNETIVSKVKEGTISIAHFSDLLRMYLLYQHGGIWMDATLFVCDDFFENLGKYSFYTIHHGKFSDYHVCKGLWSTFLFAANKGNNTIKLFCDVFESYLKIENVMLTYLLIDCVIAVAYEDIPYIRAEIDKIPPNNINVFELQPRLSEKFDSRKFAELKENTDLFKVSWKISFESKDKDTYFGHIFDDNSIEA